MIKRKVALFGGTFDPIHIGHTTVALVASERIGADKVVFIPAKRSPLKGFLPSGSDSHRLAMITLAIAENKKFDVSDFELNKPAPSYTLETVRRFQSDCGPDSEIDWLIGADGVDDLQHWYCIEDLIDSCNLCTMYRAGCDRPDYGKFEKLWGPRRVEKLQRNVIMTPLVEASSTEIRRRLAAGEDVSGMLHKAVVEYIRRHKLYCNENQTD
ncbi:MAG: nicotinate (nicotinamide) nucleotide adenylyltransferase [Sedimentisphaerales bacterium]|nr:nicotinate (nicotinamide) nucleotide adenylyltransferase [Sedimentisphaerales bacterium]